VDEREVVERVAEVVEKDCLSFLNGRVIILAPFLTVFLIDAALLEILEALVDEVSIELAMLKLEA